MAIGLGVLGFAHGHVNAYCNIWRDRPDLGISVVAGWDHDSGRLQAFADQYRIRPFTQVSALLADPAVQAVVISSETCHHADLVEQAAAAGKAIILQKPLALTMPEADRIVTAVDKSRAPFTLAWQMRVDPQNLKIKELIQSGAFGKVFMVRRRHTLSTHLWKGFADLWHNKPEYNRDIFADDAAHAIDFILWLLGEPETVTAELATIHNPLVPNDNGIAIFRYKDGPLAEVVGSFVSPAGENTTEVTAEKGNIIQNYGDAPTSGAPRPEGACGLKWYSVETGAWTYSDLVSPPGQGHRIAGVAEPLAAFLRGDRPALATAEEGRTALRMTLACYVSSREGRRTSLDDERIAAV